MIITQQTKLTFSPRDKTEHDEPGQPTAHIAYYDVQVDGQNTGITEIVVSQGRKVTTILETEDGSRYDKTQLAEALIAAGHKIEER